MDDKEFDTLVKDLEALDLKYGVKKDHRLDPEAIEAEVKRRMEIEGFKII